jgi:5,10-methenyltetrahydrofolate synthetase
VTETSNSIIKEASSLDVPVQAPASLLASKADLRRWVQERISTSNSPTGTAGGRGARLQELQARIERLLSMHPGLWLGYRAKSNEVQLPVSAAPTVQMAYPLVEGDRLEFWQGGRKFAVSKFGVEEPELSDATWLQVDLARVVGVLVPGVAFDLLGQRLGRGGGYYDRFLRELLSMRSSGSRPLMVGIGWAEQLIEQVPTEEHDVILDGVLTDRPTIWRFATTSPADAGRELSGKKGEQ